MARLPIFAILAALPTVTLSAETYQVKLEELSSPRPYYSYYSKQDGKDRGEGDLKISTDGLLDRFPCIHYTPASRRDALVYVPLSISDRTVKFKFELDRDIINGDVSNNTLGAWEANYWWGDFEDAPFENGDEMYTWGIAMHRAYRALGRGEWCSQGGIILPYYIRTLGGDRTSSQVDVSDLDGTSAILAVRMSYYDITDDLTDEDLSPRDVMTHCILVEFTSQEVDFGESSCALRDTVVDSPEEFLSSVSAASSASASGASPLLPSGREPRPTPSDDDDDDDVEDTRSGPQLNTGAVAAICIFGLGGLLLFVFCFARHYRIKREKAAAAEIEMADVQPEPPRPRHRRVDPDVVLVPAPAYQPASSEDSANGRSSHSAAVGEQPPLYGDLPPRYEDVASSGFGSPNAGPPGARPSGSAGPPGST